MKQRKKKPIDLMTSKLPGDNLKNIFNKELISLIYKEYV